MAQFDYTKFLKEGGIEKYLMEANFGNDLQSRYDYIRPLMSKLPDSARTETLIDGMEDGLREDDKTMFDYYFVEAMKELGLENELMEPDDDITPPGPEDMPGAKVPPFITDKEFQARANTFALEEDDSLINPEAEEIEDDDLAAAADYFDSLAENDKVLDEFLEMPAQEEDGAEVEVLDDVEELEIEKEQEVTININLEEGDIQVGDLVYFKGHEDKVPMEVLKVRRMFGSNLDAITTEKGEYDETQLVRAKRAVDMGDGTFQVSEMEGEVQTENKALKASNDLEAALNSVVDELTDEQIDAITDMILDLRDKVKAKKKVDEGFGDQVGAAVSGIGKGISSVLSTLIGGVIAIGVLIVTGAIAAANGILAVLGIAGVGLIRAVEKLIVVPSINSALKRLSEDEEVMAIAMKPSASGLRKIADEKLTTGERMVVGNWIKKNVTREMLGVNRRWRGGKYVATKSKKGPGLKDGDYTPLI